MTRLYDDMAASRMEDSLRDENSEESGSSTVSSTWIIIFGTFGTFVLLMCYLTRGCRKCKVMTPEQEREWRLRRLEEEMIRNSSANQSERVRKRAEQAKQRLEFVQKVLPCEECIGEMDPETGESIECSICLQAFETGDALTFSRCGCPHKFHRECMAVWLVKTKLCPVCRNTFLSQDCAQNESEKPAPQSSEGEITVDSQDSEESM